MEEEIKAVVQKIVSEGEHGPFAVATSEKFDGSVTFSLEPTIWKEEEWPEEGMIVYLAKLRQKRAGWRAKLARFWKPSDEQKERRKEMNILERVDNLIFNEESEALKEIKKLRRLMALYDSLVEKAKENNVAIVIYRTPYEKERQIGIRILPSGNYQQTDGINLDKEYFDKRSWSQKLPRNSNVGKHESAIEDYLRNKNKISFLFSTMQENSPDIQIRIEKL